MFVKVHTHGAIENTAASLLGDGGRALHTRARDLQAATAGALHYVTAREMFNVARAAMDGKTGDPERVLRLRDPAAADRAQVGGGATASIRARDGATSSSRTWRGTPSTSHTMRSTSSSLST